MMWEKQSKKRHIKYNCAYVQYVCILDKHNTYNAIHPIRT